MLFRSVNYAAKEKVAISVGFYYMSNACGRLLGTLGSGLLYTYVGEDFGDLAGTNAVQGLAACFIAGTISSLIAAFITMKINDNKAGLQCGPCICVNAQEDESDKDEEYEQRNDAEELSSEKSYSC